MLAVVVKHHNVNSIQTTSFDVKKVIFNFSKQGNMKNDEKELNSLVTLFERTQTVLQNQAARSVDITLVVRNWLFGWYIVETENGSDERSKLYGKKLIRQVLASVNRCLSTGAGSNELSLTSGY